MEEAYNNYIIVIAAIDIFVLMIMCMFVGGSSVMEKRQKRGFIALFSLVALISLFEVFAFFLNHAAVEYRWLHILSNYFGFTLSVAVPIVGLYGFEKAINLKPAILVYIIYVVGFTLSLPWGPIFSVDENNGYSRGEYFFIYTIAYTVSIIYLLFESFLATRKHQNKSRFLIFPIIFFLLLTTTIQVKFSELHTTWLSATMLTILYYVYLNDRLIQIDALTSLLRQNIFLNLPDKTTSDGSIIVFDIDDFKLINDNYGHAAGDKCLEAIAKCISESYYRHGYCYRIGGDEFAVVLKDSRRENLCYKRFLYAIEKEKVGIEYLPQVAVGSAKFTRGSSFHEAKELADKNMYICKRDNKRRKAMEQQVS